MTMTQPSSKYRRGDVVLVLFPNSNLRSAKTRPAVVVQADNLQTGLAQLIIAMITSNLARANHPSRVLVFRATPEGQLAGILTDSVVMTDNLATVMETEITRVIGQLAMDNTDIALHHTLGLPARAQ